MKKIKAYTLAEITLVLMVIGVIATVIFTVVFNDKTVSEKKKQIITKDFYSEAQNVFTKIVTSDAYDPNNTLSVKTAKKTGIKGITSYQFAALYARYAADVDITSMPDGGSCTGFTTNTSTASLITDNVSCITLPKNLRAGFFVNSSCNTSLSAAEYYDTSHTARALSGLCGYIVYEFSDQSTGTLGEDLWVIPLGNRSIK